ncbi:hypothetical protein AVEN_263181-1 [Araneus ventricosus]|uniref:Uncharacterized protein n=1 Tax=Araneus ventricosus TaxID=182803 RepID=A0A4Y2UH90_ARAVE|nr:hypothetical protein AVEN_263181-1 [Araneus ventricosus]
MPFGPVNPIDFPFGQFVFNYTHPTTPLCSVAFGHIARGSGRLNGSKESQSHSCLPTGARYALPSAYNHSTDREPLGFQVRGYTVARMS